MSKIWVTGVAGMIGSNVAQALLKNGYDVVGIDNFWRGTQKNMEVFIGHEKFRFIHADISAEIDWADDIRNDDIIVHIADIVAGIGYVFANEFEVFSQNNKINANVAKIVTQKSPERIIYLGTACSYPQGLQRDTTTSVLSEEMKLPADPESGYGWSKLLGEIELKLAVKEANTRLIVLDLHNVYGAPCVYKDSTSQVIPSLIWRAITVGAGAFDVWGDGSQGRAFVHVDDVSEAVGQAVQYQGEFDNFMIGPDYCTTIREVAETIISHDKIGVDSIRYDLDKPTGDIGRFANYSRAAAELGWRPTIDFKTGIYALIDQILETEGSSK